MPRGVYVRTTNNGASRTRLYSTWRNMKQRCFNTAHHGFKNYGGRGITVHPEWIGDFAVFREFALAHGYTDILTIDRIDSDGNYEPGNVRFISLEENSVTHSYVNIWKSVNQYTLLGEFIATFKSAKEAANQTGVNRTSISKVCNGQPHRKAAGGFIWQFV